LRNGLSIADILETKSGFEGDREDGTDCPVIAAESLDSSVTGAAKGVTLARRSGVAKGATTSRLCN
jgi:hypothetical protein